MNAPTVVAIESSFILEAKKAVFLKEDEVGKYAEIVSGDKTNVTLGLDDGVTIKVSYLDLFGQSVSASIYGTKLYFSANFKLIGKVEPIKENPSSTTAVKRPTGSAHSVSGAMFAKQ